MVFKTLLLTTILLTICTANSRVLLPTQELTPLPETRYRNRHDTPQPLKYDESSDNNYGTASSILRPGPLIPEIYQTIQYAPLYGRFAQTNKNSAAEYTKAPPTHSSAVTESNLQANGKNLYRKDYLEPRVPTGQPVMEAYKCYSSEHGIEVSPAVSRSPGHNAVYKSYEETIPIAKPFKLNHELGPYGVYYNVEITSTTFSPFELPNENIAKPFSYTNKHYVLKPNAIEREKVNKKKRQYAPYPKYHRLHLNIARVYSPGQIPVKSPVFDDTYSRNIGKLPVHSKAYNIPLKLQALPNEKTVLYPVKNNLKDFRFRFT